MEEGGSRESLQARATSSAQPRGLRDRLLALASVFTTPRSPLDFLPGRALPHGGQRVRVVRTRIEEPDTTTLTLAPAPRSFLPGQHVDLSVLEDGVLHTRTFSISSAPGARTFDVTIRAAFRGRVTPRLTRKTSPGDELRASAPKGDFVLPKERGPLLFLTAGSGVTPVMSMLRALRARGGALDAVHLHWERTAARVLFDEELSALAAARPGYRREVILTEEGGALFSAARLAEACPDFTSRATFACGPAPLLDAIHALYTRSELLPRLRVESFGLRTFGALLARGEGDSRGGRVSFTRSKTRADAEGDASLLSVAERAGLTPTHGCRRGICRSCEAPLTSGVVRDLRSGVRTRATGACVQLCVSAAASDDVEIDL